MIRRLAVLLTAAALAATTAPAHAAASRGESVRREPASVTISTTGNGHGKGLSQYGARNRANAGQGYREILEHYYPGTSWGTAGGSIRVLLTDAPDNALIVRSQSGLKARGQGKTWTLPTRRDGKPVKKWRVKTSGTRSELSYRTGSWHVWRTRRGAIELVSARPMVLFGAGSYRGVLRLTDAGVVNEVPLETYLRGVVASEVPATWPHAAVEAQSVAARTYAVFEREHVSSAREYDLCDTAACQVYRGASGEHPGSDAAVRTTAGQVLTYEGEPIFAQFSASNGGYSVADERFPYLVAEWDEFDRGVPQDPQVRTFTGDQITRHWTGLGDLVSVEVTERDTDGVHEGHVTELRITGTLREQVTTGSAFARFLGLRSTMFTVS
ncbi:SpoIID/LytB domain-containing protein [Nocardioides sp.]|uniref:SpoIID/LytB domain-containing protein n=1 Tax=Nocardioides sp. TaxID=35761 RepID=UPI0025D3580B|nr:SpoIID/LytB domain-containing protein [Nocardioides sp.]